MDRGDRAAAGGEMSAAERFAAMRDFYVEQHELIPAEARRDALDTLLRRLRKVVPVDPGTSLLELGMANGWLLILAAERGLRAAGLEHNPELAELARRGAADAGVSIDVHVGLAEGYPLDAEAYDVVLANSVLEHVPDYRAVIANAYRALRPGGVFYLDSSNKFALRSGEYPKLRLYGWLPYRARRWIRVREHGQGLVTVRGMDFNQFTYPGLRRELKRAGFSRVIDIYDLLDVEDLNHPTRVRTAVMRAYKRFRPLKWLLTTFSDGTYFYCVK